MQTAWSDLELGVVWSRPPARGERARVAGAGARLFDCPDEALPWFDEWWLGSAAGGGLLAECSHLTAAAPTR